MDEIPTALRDTSSNSKGNKKVFFGRSPFSPEIYNLVYGGYIVSDHNFFLYQWYYK